MEETSVRHSEGTTVPAARKEQTRLTRAMETIRSLRRQLAEQRGTQPVAVIGIGLRLPGGIDGPDRYWDALAEGRDLVRPMPEERKHPFRDAWEGLPQRGGFLDDVLDFDAGFFGISPREARHLDPQHRLLLEVSWEALENAALPTARLTGSTGFYLGIMWQDYRDWLTGQPDAYWTTGNGHNFAAGRIAYALGLTGPTLAVDTACSSSLVAVHLAVQALRRQECDVALAAGANLMLSPRSMRLVQETRSLSPDGLCRTFDARANGFTRGEGIGVVVLKRLDRALADGDRVHAVIRGSAVNQDGRSGGFTAPNVLSQTALIERALGDAGLEPSDIGYVETHGTGTALGDPIEIEALATALGRRNGGAPLPVGAVKTNLGHLEGAAGIAGLVKAVLCVQRRKVPPLVHFRTLNPRIDLSGTEMSMPTELLDWDQAGGRYAGVSSFGMSGTNAHVVLGPREAPPDAPGEGPPGHSAPADLHATGFDISARSHDALRALAARYAATADRTGPADYPAFCYTADQGRDRHEFRARISARDPHAAAEALRALASGTAVPSVTLLHGDEAPGDTETGPAPALPRRIADLPHYPWQRSRYEPVDLPGAIGAVTADADDAAAGEDRAGAEAASHAAYEITWEQLPLPEPGTGGSLVLAGDDTGLLRLISDQAETLGLPCTLLTPGGPAFDAVGRPTQALPRDDDAWHRFWTAWEPAEPVTLLLVFTARPLPADAEQDSAADGGALCAAVSRAAAGLQVAGPPRSRALAVTVGARCVVADDRVQATHHGALHGLSPVLGLEAGASWGGVVDLPCEPSAEDTRSLLVLSTAWHRSADADASRVAGMSAEDVAAVRTGGIYVPRLRPAPQHTERLPVREDGSYLVTGGLGAVGRELAAELVRRGARHLLLIGRRGEEDLAPGASAALDALRARGANVVYRGGGCDTPEALAAACEPLAAMPPVRGVLHAAGTLEQAPAALAGEDGFARALAAKPVAAWWLHRASERWPLDFFVMVSSVSAVWGTENCAAYSAANGALDMLVAHRRGLGLPAVSLAYGPWDLGSEGMADDALRARVERLGVRALDAATGRAALTARVPSAAGHRVACPLDVDRFSQVMSALRPRGLFAGLTDAPHTTSAAPAAASVVAELAGVPERARPAAARAHVRRIVAELLGHADASAVRDRVGFLDLGLDSIMAVDLVARLTSDFGTAIRVSDVFDHPTVEELVAFLRTRWDPSATAAPSVPPAPRQRARPVAPAPAGDEQRGADSGSAGEGEAIAIVGMAGRFPGSDSVDELWELLITGRDGVGPVPQGRWDGARFHTPGTTDPAQDAGRITTDQGGFLRDISSFDAAFFDIPAREAEHLDPQQRLLLESAWHALEDSGTDPRSLRNSRTGVFVGISYSDYARLLAEAGPEQIDAYYSTGTALNAAAGRLAFTLGLGGPALAVDTACSSSLVAVHLAVRSLRSGETDAVLAGGVNVLLDPVSSIAVSRAHMLSPDGRCRSFSSDANGFVRAEGCGVLVLKRLSDAQRDGDRVHAVIRGSAVNQDGASSGLTAPSGRAQEDMLRAALQDAGTEGRDVSYLEAHGTGTSLGDPVELQAVWRVLGSGRRPDEPLHIGAVKSNIGHCESAAGMAGIFKTVLAMRHGVIPANLHFAAPNPHVAWADMNVRVVDTATPWRADGRPRVAGVSGFGFTGTNAHLVLADAPETQDAPVPDNGGPAVRPTCLLPLSAPDTEGLERLSSAWRHRLVNAAEEELTPLALTAGRGRAQFAHRRCLIGASREELLAGLDEETPRTTAGPPRIAFLFAGQGSQFFGMGRELYETEPVFRETFDRCDRILAPSLGASLTDLVFYGSDRDAVHETRVTQPALVTLEVSLAALWESWGVEPAVVMGHSVGEIAAALHAGVMDLTTGLTLIADRARLMQGTDRGAMLSVLAPESRVLEWIADHELDIAAVNGPEATVVSGAPVEIDALAARLTEERVRHRRLGVSHAFHSRLLDPVLDEFAALLKTMEFRSPRVPAVSNLTGEPVAPGTYDADYWTRHARNPVLFHTGAQALAGLGVDLCLEIGPDRTLINLVRAAGAEPPGGLASSLRRGKADRASLLTAARTLYLRGQDLDWRRVQPPSGVSRADAPLYPFAPERHWVSRPPRTRATTGVRAATAGAPPWGTPLSSPALRGRVFVTERSTHYPAHLTDHRLFGTVSVPGASQTATVLSALGADGTPVVLEDLHFPRALVLREGERYDVQIIDAEQDHGTRTVSVQSLTDPERGTWQEHLAARVVPYRLGQGAAEPLDIDAFVAGADRHLGGDEFYRHLHSLGYHLGSSFRWIGDAWLRGDEALIRYRRPEQMNESSESYEIHPGLLDSCLQSAVTFAVAEAMSADPDEEQSLAIPFAAARVSFPGRPGGHSELWGHVRAELGRRTRTGDFGQVESADLRLFDDSGATVLAVDGFRFRRAPRALLQKSLREGTPHAYRLGWIEQPPPARAEGPATHTRRHVALVGATQEAGSTVRETLEALGHRVSPVAADAAGETDADIVVDARFGAPGTEAGHDDALAAALALTASLRAAPRHLPYAVLFDHATDATAPLRESLWGLLASLETEQPGRRLLRIGLGADWDAGTVARTVIRALDEDFPERRVEVAGGTVRVARLVPYTGGATAGGHAPSRPDADGGAALITGGLGALGLSAAAFLARHGVTAVTLMARSEPDAAARRAIAELTAGGTRVRVVGGDVTDLEDCRRAVAEASEDAPLRTVLHLAGCTRDGAFEELSSDSFAAVFAAKTHGAENLVEALRGHDLDALVLFSSAAGVLGAPGQSNYAAANGFLDGLAHRLRGRGMPAISVDWGPWVPRHRAGLAGSDAVGRAAAGLGVRVLGDDEAEELLRLALTDRPRRLVAVALDTEGAEQRFAGQPRAILLRDGTRRPAAGGDGEPDRARPRGWLRPLLAELDGEDHREAVRHVVRELTGQTLGDSAVVDDERGFGDMGLDSIMVIDLRTRLSHALGVDLPATAALDHPTVTRISDYALGLLFPAESAPADDSRPRTPASARTAPPRDERAPEDLTFDQLLEAVRTDVAAEK
ncbi:SDR family NAD(P)-dependent oxidoreductase [Streptomyces coeruleorubidus]|uniref:SDR family NAD(P)-dependent oxidoreductase n=1 Tax=Streptomyces coeruleorubidus TaxID=116188 RepID=UPI0037A38BD9